MTQSRIRIGVVGAGWPGQQHARGIRASFDAVLQALAEPNDERAAEFGATHAPRTLHSDYRALLGDPAIDAVVICLPTICISRLPSLRSVPANMSSARDRRP